jgi:serine/threonine protein kinase
MATQPAAQDLAPNRLPPRTKVGPWQVLELRGRGGYGVVYRVERLDKALGESFALKLALRPEDPRFEREVELLSRLHHPNVPALHDRGQWAHPRGPYPFLVMEWVDGVPLYEWALERQLCSREVMRVLAQVARALAATHAVGGCHRDVKGENTLVRHEDGRVLLVDFGVGDYEGARTLTHEVLPPGTPEYRSPEALLFQWRHWRERGLHYEPGPADDVYALGVMAWRLVTGLYPPSPIEEQESPHILPGRRKLLDEMVSVSPELARLIHQMLSREPSARGSAAELAEALDRMSERAGAETDAPIIWYPIQKPVVQMSRPGLSQRVRAWAPWVVATAGVLLAVTTWWSQHQLSVDGRAGRGPEKGGSEKTARDPAGLADTLRSVSSSPERPEPVLGGIRLAMPKEPLPGQARPPCHKHEIEINGGCWINLIEVKPPCTTRSYEWKSRCYSPAPVPPRPTTSDPQ